MLKNRYIFMIHMEYEGYRLQSPGLYRAIASKIKEFYSEYGIRIEGIIAWLIALDKKYYEFEGDKIKIIIVKTEGQPDREDYAYKAGMTGDMKNNEYNEFMDTEIGMKPKSHIQVVKS